MSIMWLSSSNILPVDELPPVSGSIVGETEPMADYSKGLQLAFFLTLTDKTVNPMRLKETEPQVM